MTQNVGRLASIEFAGNHMFFRRTQPHRHHPDLHPSCRALRLRNVGILHPVYIFPNYRFHYDDSFPNRCNIAVYTSADCPPPISSMFIPAAFANSLYPSGNVSESA